ncbi:MAG: hypothetical protein NWS47_02985 [Alphaproteobacteria bacterium]|nr:hypothetical protein [Alphaproteobacteria bacterium]
MYVLILCARKLVLVAWLLCLLNVGISYAVDRFWLDEKSSFSASALRKGEEKVLATMPSLSAAQNSVDCSSCFPSIRLYSFWNASDRKKRKVAATPSGSYGKNSLKGERVGQISQAERFAHHLKKDEDDEASITDKEFTIGSAARENPSTLVDSGDTVAYHNSLPRIESSSDASVDPTVARKNLRMLFVEDDPEIRESIETVLVAYNNDLSKKYRIEYKILTHGFLAIDYLLSSENFSPHIIVTDNNMEFFSSRNKIDRLNRKAGCELGKCLRPERIESGECPSIYNFECINKTITNQQRYTAQKMGRECTYERIDCDCVFSDEFLTFDTRSFQGLVFLSTSDSPEELGPKNIALFDGLPPKLKYGRTFNDFFKKHEDKIDEVINKY